MKWGADLQSEHERWLTERHVGRPVIVTDYPKEIKAFYMYANDDERTVRAMDVLVPKVGEIIGGSQREDRLDVLRARLRECGLRRGALRLVSRPAPLRLGAARRLRPRLRAAHALPDRHGEHPRRDPVPARAGVRGVLSVTEPRRNQDVAVRLRELVLAVVLAGEGELRDEEQDPGDRRATGR